MISKQLVDKIDARMRPNTNKGFNLNFKVVGEDADKFDVIATAMNISRTELAKTIISASLDDMLNVIQEMPSMTTESGNGFTDLEQQVYDLALRFLEDTQSGVEFELKTLFSEAWEEIGDHGAKNRAGKIFRQFVDNGVIGHVAFVRTEPNNHALYVKL
jgi:hypothetical protein